jgi:C-3',4' desaturase CrtD
MTEQQAPQVVVIGAGIGGLTAAALLAQSGYRVIVLEQSSVVGGCASTFRRRGFTFDVGATQVAGLEPGGIHQRLFDQLAIPLPEATPCDPACAVYLPGEREPISVWRDPQRWRQERQRQFPGSEPFWQLLKRLFEASWRFQGHDPVLPPRNLWDVGQLLQALRPDTLITLPYTFATVGDALRQFGLDRDLRLRRFLDLQLKLYSQVEVEETALLYAATALSVSQAPQGLSHLEGSMQVLGDRLAQGLQHWGGELRLRQRVEGIQLEQGRVVGVQLREAGGDVRPLPAEHVVANVTVQNLLSLLGQAVVEVPALGRYQRRVEKLAPASGAFVVYLGVDQAAIPLGCPPHLQFLYDPDGPIGENNSLFVSVSRPGDGRAPAGQATIIASSFTDVQRWWRAEDYEVLKQQYTAGAIARLGQFFDLRPEYLLHVEAGTPRTFARFTARDQGAVGGVGMRLTTFGPFGFATRTPVPGLWLVGDSTHPGEGTAGVSYSALTVARQIVAHTGRRTA